MRRALRPASLLAALLLAVTLGPFHGPVAHAAASADPIIHIVQPGETLDFIGLQYGVSWTDLMRANQLTSTDIYVGLPILPDGQRLWDGYLGTPVSFVCVILGVNEAQTLYDWADVGTPVIIRE